MRSSARLGLAALVAIAALASLPAPVEAQIYVVPRRAGKSNVRTFDFDWKHVDLLVDERIELPMQHRFVLLPSTDDDARPDDREGERDPNVSAGIRLYFYEREREIAQRAADQIVATYRDLARTFGIVPRAKLPYVLYSSYQEFLQTNLFPVQEGVLGVTSTTDLTLTLPYFGDYRLFREISRHEMAHQFTIQKAAMESRSSSALGVLPLWFIEGLAELYAHQGLDPETELVVHDLVLNPDLLRGFGMLGFFDDRPGSVLWTYDVGLARCVFLEETYGAGTVQRVLGGLASVEVSTFTQSSDSDFAVLLQSLVGEPPDVIASRFDAWIKDRAIASHQRARQSPAAARTLTGFSRPSSTAIIQSMRTSPSGELMMLRRIDGTTAQTSLVLLDHRAPDQAEEVVSDGRPGVESLHPIYDQSFDVSDRLLAFVAEASGRDLLYVQPIARDAEPIVDRDDDRDPDAARPIPHDRLGPALTAEDAPTPTDALRVATATISWDVELSLGDRRRFDPSDHDLIAIFSPAIAPDDRAIAFIGLDRRGQRDLYVLRALDTDGGRLERVTNDAFSERGVDWGPRGLVYGSDATEHGRFNLFVVDPETKVITRLTSEPRDHLTPAALPDGGVVFVAYRDARANVYEVTPRGIVQRTDVPTGLFDPGPAPGGGLWALHHRQGAKRPARIATTELLARMPAPDEPEGLHPPRLARTSTATFVHTATRTPGLDRPLGAHALSIAGAEDYDLVDLSNWGLNNVFALVGAGGGGVFGRVIAAFSDRLRLNGVLVDVSALGALELTEGVAIYVNQASQATWGFGPFQSLSFRLDPTFGDRTQRFFSAERFYGGLGILRYPLNRYFHLQGQLAIGGTDFVVDRDVREYLRDLPDDTGTGSLYDAWERENARNAFQTELTLGLGWDTLRYHPLSGPIGGRSFLLEGSAALQPDGEEIWGSLRLDAQEFLHLFGRSALMLRLGAGTIFGGTVARQYFLSSFDTLRGVRFGDLDLLLGSKFLYSTAELQLPLDALVAAAFFSSIEGVVGFDFGGVGGSARQAWDNRVLDFAWGFNFGLGPIVLRLHFARAIDIGAPLPVRSGSKWVTNFSLGWLYF
ncbi:tolB protein precursor protein [Myxococcota bacterium]|nr:tolB protein precursor protein [Myxococcota bacterium]